MMGVIPVGLMLCGFLCAMTAGLQLERQKLRADGRGAGMGFLGLALLIAALICAKVAGVH